MLHELVEYARSQGLASEPGFKAKEVRWLLIFDSEGRWSGIQNLAGDSKVSKGFLYPKCPDLSMPEMISAGKGTRHFLVDALDKIVLLTKDGEITPKLSSEHDYFVNLLRQASVGQAVLASIADTLSDPEQLQLIRDSLAQHKAKPTDSATLAVSDPSTGRIVTIVAEAWWHDWWRGFRQNLLESRQSKGKAADASEDDQMLCLLTGESVKPAATHPKINGLSDVGGLATGDALLSFNKDAFTSYDLEQGCNAAISEEMAAAYAGALNDLLRTRCHRLAGMKIVYWYEGAVIEPGGPDDLVSTTISFNLKAVPDDDQDDQPSENEINSQYGRAAKLLRAIQSGERPDLLQARFNVLILSANSGRVVIREWQQGSFVDLSKAVKAWFDDLSITARDGMSVIRSHKLMALVGACVRDLKDAPTWLQIALWRSALNAGRAIPDSIIAPALGRVRNDILNDESPRHSRFALLKAYLIRKGHPMTEVLNEHCKDPAYLCGRLLAQLAHIQYKALGDVGANVIQRYYAAASATPALVLGRLVRTANTGHLPKLEENDRFWAEKNLCDIWNQLSQQPPVTLSLEQQTLFAMGYYQQLSKRYTTRSKEEVPAATAQASEA